MPLQRRDLPLIRAIVLASLGTAPFAATGARAQQELPSYPPPLSRDLAPPAAAPAPSSAPLPAAPGLALTVTPLGAAASRQTPAPRCDRRVEYRCAQRRPRSARPHRAHRTRRWVQTGAGTALAHRGQRAGRRSRARRAQDHHRAPPRLAGRARGALSGRSEPHRDRGARRGRARRKRGIDPADRRLRRRLSRQNFRAAHRRAADREERSRRDPQERSGLAPFAQLSRRPARAPVPSPMPNGSPPIFSPKAVPTPSSDAKPCASTSYAGHRI